MGEQARASMLDGLTDEQRRAVEHTGGPLIVLAGPGTGKTRVITHRVAHAVLHRGIEPEHVMACTFTNAASNELRGRLEPLIGPARAQAVRASTLHAWGAGLITRHRGALGLPARTTIIDVVSERRLLREVVREAGLFDEMLAHRLRHEPGADTSSSMLAPLDAEVSQAQRAIQAMANAGILPDEALARGRELLASVDGSAAQRLEAERTMILTRAYDLSTRARWRRGLLTYDDLQTLPLLALRSLRDVATRERARARCIVVDEFQDLNPAQIRLLCLLAGDGGESPDLCVVGDDDQSIYAFRGASDRGFATLRDRYPSTTVVALSESFRSLPGIVEAAQCSIARSGQRFMPDKRVRAMREARPGSVPCVELVSYPKDVAHADATVREVLALRSSGEGASLAVIASSNDAVREIGALLRASNVPCLESASTSLFDQPVVRSVLAWLRWLIDDGDAMSALDVLLSPPASLPPPLVALLARVGKKAASWSDLLSRVAQGEVVLDEDPPTEQQLDVLRRVVAMRAALRTTAVALPAGDALEEVVRAVDPIHAGLPEARERSVRLRAIVRLLRFARTKQSLLPQPMGLRELLDYIDELLEIDPKGGDKRAGDHEELAEEMGEQLEHDDARAEGVDSADEGTVRVMTAHASKGLEFRTVIVHRVSPQSGGFSWVRPREDSLPAGFIPFGETSILTETQRAQRQDDEVRRRFYVAITRAEDRLILLSPELKSKKSTSPRHYFLELDADLSVAHRRGVAAAPGDDMGGTPEGGLPLRTKDRASMQDRVRGLLSGLRAQIAHAVDEIMERWHAESDDEGVRSSPRARIDLLLARARALSQRDPLEAVLRLGPGHEGFARALEHMLREPQTRDDVVPPEALRPLTLSFTSLDLYDRCPACWHARHVLGLPDADSQRQRLGTIVHDALSEFYRSWSLHDSEGVVLGLDDLLAVAARHIEAAGDVPEDERGRTVAILRRVWTNFHDPSAHVLATEESLSMPLVVDGVAHTLKGDIDRIDQVEAGQSGRPFRVIDYKTGGSWESLINPKPDNLQMGIYALLLRDARKRPDSGIPDFDPSTEATFTYWLIGTGHRGEVQFSDENISQVEAKIASLVRKIRGGLFEVGPRCAAICTRLSSGSMWLTDVEVGGVSQRDGVLEGA